MQVLSDDLLDGAGPAAQFVFGDEKKRRRIYRMTETGALPAIRIGNRLFYRKGDLERVFSTSVPNAS